jgi:hypothetical protein
MSAPTDKVPCGRGHEACDCRDYCKSPALPPCGHPFTRPGEKCHHCGAITWAPLYHTTEELRRVGG